jgi:hypothetical protein
MVTRDKRSPLSGPGSVSHDEAERYRRVIVSVKLRSSPSRRRTRRAAPASDWRKPRSC